MFFFPLSYNTSCEAEEISCVLMIIDDNSKIIFVKSS